MTILYDEINKFVKYQNILSSTFFLKYPDLKDFVKLLDFPRQGYLDVNNEVWKFNKHGVGVLFVRYCKEPNIKIDITNYINNPNIFDSWRLSIYLNSINCYIYDFDLERKLKEMELDGKIKKYFDIGNYYILNDQIIEK